MRQEIKEIRCNVTNCVYNEDGRKCMAGHIDVGPSNASTSSETLCGTFENEKGTSKGCGCSF